MKFPTGWGRSQNDDSSPWLKKMRTITLDELIAELTLQAHVELPEKPGILRIVAKEKETLPIGGWICKIEINEGATAPAAGKKADEPAPAANTDKSYASGHPSPAAAKILDEKGVPSGQVAGTGVGGRVTKDDAQKASPPKPADAKPKAPASAPVISSGGGREVRNEKIPLPSATSLTPLAVKNETGHAYPFNM